MTKARLKRMEEFLCFALSDSSSHAGIIQIGFSGMISALFGTPRHQTNVKIIEIYLSTTHRLVWAVEVREALKEMSTS